MSSVHAIERVNTARGVSTAIGLAFKKAGDLPESLRDELREAFIEPRE